ncbi:MAG TPA: hypothetical protein VI583_09965 [Cyclobacteriaceae bacterium]|nr:hypothetical protein [Cyclobacteriaceae bacterium]
MGILSAEIKEFVNRFKGSGSVLSNGPLYEEIITHYGEAVFKYTIRHIVLVRVEEVAGLYSPVYETGVTEDEVRMKWIDYWKSLNEEKKDIK